MYTALVIGIVGLLIWYICTRLELGWDASDIFFAAEHKAREKMTRSDRSAHRQERSLARRAVGFFGSIGVGLSGLASAGRPSTMA